jgi:hypothetical protein
VCICVFVCLYVCVCANSVNDLYSMNCRKSIKSQFVCFFSTARTTTCSSSSITQIISLFTNLLHFERKENGIMSAASHTMLLAHWKCFVGWRLGDTSGRTHTSLLALRRRSRKGAQLFALQNHNRGGLACERRQNKRNTGNQTTNCIFQFFLCDYTCQRRASSVTSKISTVWRRPP